MIIVLGIVIIIYVFPNNNNTNKDLKISDFYFITHDTSLEEVYKKLGEPQRDVCSGVYCPDYYLSDGTYVRINTGDPNSIWSVTVIDKNGEVLLELLSK